MDKIIFLDIDGVLNVIPESFDEFGSVFHKEFEENLKWIISETNAKIVISSSWRTSGLEIMKEMWKKRGLAGEIIGRTPTDYELFMKGLCKEDEYVPRGEEIQHYINDNNIKKYCIIDDDDSMLLSQLKYFVKTSDNQDHPDCIDIGYGLTKKCSEKVIKILNS